MKHSSLSFIAAAVLLVGAGCAKNEPQAPVTNTPSVNAPATNTSGSTNGNTNGGDTNGNTNGTGGTAQTGTKKYNSAPYDFSYPAKYILSDHAMTDAMRKPYLDAGLDAPLQNVSLATVVRPDGFEGEGPATIHVTQWNNANRTPLREWAKKQGSYTGFTAAVDASGKVSTEAFQGKPSLSYEYAGLYGGKARLIDLGGTVLQVSADFDAEQGNTNMAAFDTILSTMTFGK